jgi:hypothetical protein
VCAGDHRRDEPPVVNAVHRRTGARLPVIRFSGTCRSVTGTSRTPARQPGLGTRAIVVWAAPSRTLPLYGDRRPVPRVEDALNLSRTCAVASPGRPSNLARPCSSAEAVPGSAGSAEGTYPGLEVQLSRRELASACFSLMGCPWSSSSRTLAKMGDPVRAALLAGLARA